MTTPVDWLERTAYVWCGGPKCKPQTLIRSWNGAGYVLARCAWCREKATCPLCGTGHDNGKCAAEGAA